MNAARAQRGASLLLLLLVIVMGIIALLASVVVTRLSGEVGENATTLRHLERAAEALEAYAATARRLPCPANPAVDDGVEVTATAGTCQFPAGTIPWKTIGLARSASFDAWDLKISYRVYTGNAGSLTQPNGVSMVECDTVEPSVGAATVVDNTNNTGRLCVSDANVLNRSTRPDRFLLNKGLSLEDKGTKLDDVAYVLISHGATGYGAFTATGTRRTMPTGDEDRNAGATGPFTVKAFSDADTEASKATHFDDLVVYRRLADLVGRIKLGARDWPDVAAGPGLVFDAPTVARGTGDPGATIMPGSLSRSTLTYTDSGTVATTVTAQTGGTASTLSYDDAYGSTGGIGVYGAPLLFFGLSSNLILSDASESVRFDFAAKLRKFAITLNDFGQPTYFIFFYPFTEKFTEQVQLTFYDTAVSTSTPVMTLTKAACREPDGLLASFSIDVPADFDRVDVTPLQATPEMGYPTGFLISAFTACTAAVASCVTPLATTGTGGNTCP